MIDAIFPLLLLVVLVGWAWLSFREILVQEKPPRTQADLGRLAREHREHVQRMASRGVPLPGPGTVDWDRVVNQILEET